MKKERASQAALLLCLTGSLSLVSCVAGITPNAKYTPVNRVPPPSTRMVTLKVVDDRDPKLGGIEKNLVGQARGGYGNPFGVREDRTDTVTRLVTEATTDALHQAGIGTDGGDRTLVATVKKYWADGYNKYNAEMEVWFELRSASGEVPWKATVQATSAGKLGMKPKTRMKKLFDELLETFAKNALEEFRTPTFQGGGSATPLSASGAGVGAKLYSKDGSYFGEVVGTLGDKLVVTLANGVRATISLGQAAEMMRKDSMPISAAPSAPPPPPTIRPGVRLLAPDGKPFGTVTAVSGDSVSVQHTAGATVTLTMAQAMEMLPK